ncbi:MAG: hypothetical protein ACE5FI_07360 [Anaerolineales bacterium]
MMRALSRSDPEPPRCLPIRIDPQATDVDAPNEDHVPLVVHFVHTHPVTPTRDVLKQNRGYPL